MSGLDALGVPTRLAQRGWTRDQIIAEGKDLCSKIEAGASVQQLQMNAAQNFLATQETDLQYVKDTGYLLGYAVQSFCPQYKVQLNAP